MTVLLENRQQIAAPKRARPLLPLALRTFSPADPATPDAIEVPDATLDAARRFAEENSDSSIAWARLAQAELMAGDSERVRSASLQAIQKASSAEGSESTLVAAIVALIASGNEEDAERSLHELRDLASLPSTILATLEMKRGNTRSAMKRLESVDTSESWFLRGVIAYENGLFGAAIHAYRSAIRLSGPTPATLTNLGVAYASNGQMKKAISLTRQALAMAPSQDECVSFNLAGYLVATGDTAAALEVIRRLRLAKPAEIQPVFAESGIRLFRGEVGEAYKLLRRARTNLWPSLNETDQSELEANLAFVRWHSGDRSREQAATEILSALAGVDYANVQLAGMITVLKTRFSDASEVKRVFARVRDRNPNEKLFALDIHQAMLERRFDFASRLAKEWAENSVLDPVAATIATYLTADVDRDYARAAQIGIDALKRMPAAERIRNNVAYALAMLGQVSEAREFLPKLEFPQHFATNALINLRSGDEKSARDLYLMAFKRATKLDEEFGVLVQLNSLVAASRFGSDEMKSWASEWVLPFDQTKWSDSPPVALTLELLSDSGVIA
jgi:Flp pilus assembly protein TadD